MSALLFLAGALVLPPLGLLLGHPVMRRFRGARRLLGLVWHLLTLWLWSSLAWIAGHPAGHEAGWDNSRIALVLGAGLVYAESLFLLSLPWHRNGVALEAPVRTASGLEIAQAEEAAPEETGLDDDGADTEGEEDAEQAFSPEGISLLRRIQGLESVAVEAIMTPREGVIHVDENLSAEATLERMRQTGRSRLLVTSGGSLERIMGIVHAKDLVPLLAETDGKEPVRRHLRRWLRVAQGESVARLLDDFRRGRVHVGVVGDPLGQTLGVVTLRDVQRYIAGGAAVGAQVASRP